MKKVIIVFAVLLLTLTGCGNSSSTYKTVNMEEAKKMIETNADVIVLDVRTLEEFNEGHIPNALLYPVQELDQRWNELDKSKTYLIVCRSGNRSQTASDILIKNGFKHVYNTSGGMNQWSGEIVK